MSQQRHTETRRHLFRTFVDLFDPPTHHSLRVLNHFCHLFIQAWNLHPIITWKWSLFMSFSQTHTNTLTQNLPLISTHAHAHTHSASSKDDTLAWSSRCVYSCVFDGVSPCTHMANEPSSVKWLVIRTLASNCHSLPFESEWRLKSKAIAAVVKCAHVCGGRAAEAARLIHSRTTRNSLDFCFMLSLTSKATLFGEMWVKKYSEIQTNSI